MSSSKEVRRLWKVLTLVLVSASAALPIFGQLATGDVLASVAPPSALPGEIRGSIEIYAATGGFKSQIVLPLGFPVSSLNVWRGELIGIASGPAIWTISLTGVLGGFTPPILAATSIAFDASGNLFVSDGATLKKYDSSLNLVRTFALPEVAWEIDLAPDQCTMYYVSAPDIPVQTISPAVVARYDVCAAQPLSNLTTSIPLLGSTGTLRVLPGNDVLLGTFAGVLRFAPNGTLTRTYSGGPMIALDVDGQSFWEAGGADRAHKIDLATGNEIGASDPYGATYKVFSLGIVGEPRAGLTAGAAIPALSSLALFGLLITLSAAGWVACRR